MNRLWLLLLPFIFVSSVWAEEKIKVEEIVVTATRYEKKITDIPANITVITEENISQSTASSIPDLLRTTAGIYVSDIMGNRRSTTVDVRGFGETASSNTLILVDGMRLNQADLSGTDWMLIPLERVKRIEIIRGGSGSVMYGDNATGGVINIITKEGKGFKTGAEFTTGSYDTYNTNAYVSGSVKDLSFHLSGKYLSSDGYRDNSKVDSRDFGLNTSYYLKDLMKINFSSGYHKEDVRLPGALKESDFNSGAERTDSLHPDDFAITEDYYFKLNPEIYFLGDNIFKVDASLRKRAFLAFSSGDWGNFLGDTEIKTFIISPQIVLKNDFKYAKNNMTIGIDYQNIKENILNSSLFFGFPSSDSFDLSKESFGYYLHDEVSIMDNLRLSGGYRHDKARFTFHPSSPDDSTDVREDAYTAGINYTFYKKSYAYFSYSRGFRYPLFDEIFSFFTNTVNTDLTNQRSDNFEIGLRHYLADDIYVHLNVFRVDTDREIFFNPVTYTNENFDGMTRRDGIEVSFDAKAYEWLTLRGNYTYLDAKIRDGKDFPGVPKNKGSLEIASSFWRGFTASLNGSYIGKRTFISDFENDFGKHKDIFIMNAKFAYKWKSLKAFLDINNLTDREYSEFGVAGGFPVEKAYYPSPKRNFLAGVSYEF